MRIKMLQAVGDHAKGAIVPIEDSIAKRYVAAGLAEEQAGDGAAALDNFAETIKKAVAQGYAAGRAEAEAGGGGISAEEKANRLRIDAGEAEADKTKSFADFIKQIIIVGCPNLAAAGQLPFENARPHEAAERLAKVYKSVYRTHQKDLAEGSGTTGGYTVAPTYGRELLMLAAEESIVRPYANVKKLPAREAYYPMLNQTFTPAGGQSGYYGGVLMTWTGEAQPRAATEPAFKQVHVVTNELGGLCKISRTLMSDSMLEMQAELRALFAGAIAYAEDMAFLNGDGVAKPKGILQAAATITYPTRITANQFKLADAANMMGAMIASSRPKSVWIATSALFPQLVQLVDASGRVTYIPNVGTGYGDAKLAMGQLLLFGRPVVLTEKLPALGAVGDVLLADLSKYIVADTGTLEIAASDQYAFNTNQITFRVIQRVDGQPQLDAPFVQQDGTTQASPFVILDADVP
jgi:HK97 family phage major capsid protein